MADSILDGILLVYCTVYKRNAVAELIDGKYVCRACGQDSHGEAR